MKSELKLLARRYAQAHLNLFGSGMTLLEAQNLSVLGDILTKHRSLLLFNGIYQTHGSTNRPIVDLFKMSELPAAFYESLLDLLANQNRLFLLPFILKEIYRGFLEIHGIMHFTLESALPLLDAERDAFLRFLRKKTQKEIHYTLVINPALIAGIKMYSETLGFECSVQQRLNELNSKNFLFV
jgi:F0F1-type ATP synthase delta subunit